MKIRTRYKLFKILIALAVIVFVLSLYDIFANASDWFVPIMAAYVLLAIVALILYIGYKPTLDEEEPKAIVAAPEPVAPQDVVEAVEPPPGWSLEGPHDYRCPFCANIFALELTHLRKEHELRMDCPFCDNTIRIPPRPKIAPGSMVDMNTITVQEQAVFSCRSCGEDLRYSAPGQITAEHARVYTCPHCGSDQVAPSMGASAA